MVLRPLGAISKEQPNFLQSRVSVSRLIAWSKTSRQILNEQTTLPVVYKVPLPPPPKKKKTTNKQTNKKKDHFIFSGQDYPDCMSRVLSHLSLEKNWGALNM